MLVIENKYMRRAFDAENGNFRTVEYSTGNGDALIQTPSETEGSLEIDGQTYNLAADGVRSMHMTGSETIEPDDQSRRLKIRFENSSELPGLELAIIYTIRTDLPVLTKHIEAFNRGEKRHVISGMELENFELAGQGSSKLLLEDDYVRDAFTIAGKRAYSPWIEEQQKYIDTFLNPPPGPCIFAYPADMDWQLEAGERFQSFKVFEFVLPNADRESTGLEMRKITRELFPWTRERYLGCKIAPARANVEDYYRAIDRCADAGFEAVTLHHGWIDGKLTHPLFTNYNDYELRPELFPNGWEDVRKLTGYAHEKGLLASFYSIYVNTWIELGGEQPKALDEHDWELVWAADDDSARWGTSLDPATGWGGFINDRLPAAIETGGFDAWHLDGPYYGDICVAAGRDYKPGGPNQILAWERQKEFYEKMRAAGIQGEAAQAFPAFAHGCSRVTTSGYNEGDFADLSIREQILANRRAAYDFTYLYRPEQATTSIPVVPWSEDPGAPSLLPLEEHAEEYDAYLANMYGYGFEGKPFCAVPYDGPGSKHAVQRWLNFWKANSDYFKEGYLLHIRRPDGKNIDAVLHALEKNSERQALLVVFNPADKKQSDTIEIPFDKLGWNESSWRARDENGNCRVLRQNSLCVEVPASNATWYKIELQES